MESAELAKKKGLAVVAGFCWRYHCSRREFFKRIADGAIGDVQTMYATYYTGPVKPMPPDSARKEEWSDIEWQVRNWYNFTWCGGDGLVEQAVHSVDKISWLFGDEPPRSAVAVGGRQRPNIPATSGIISRCQLPLPNGAEDSSANARFPAAMARITIISTAPRAAPRSPVANASSRTRTASGATKAAAKHVPGGA